MPTRSPSSHKGQNGNVAIVGGSPTMHGAPLFAALAAEASGVDLIHIRLPKCHATVAKQASLNVQVMPFVSDALSKKDLTSTLNLLESMDAAVVGPGMDESSDILKELIAAVPCPVVLDAAALRSDVLTLVQNKSAILTPHRGELQRIGLQEEELPDIAKRYDVTIFLKGETDTIVDTSGRIHQLTGGNAGLTVGGTGDVLAGLIAGLIAQGIDHTDACLLAGRTIKRAATVLYHDCGYSFTAEQVVQEIPHLLHTQLQD